MNIGIRLHDCAGDSLEERLANAQAQGFTCVHLALHRVIPGFQMDKAPELLTDGLAAAIREALDRHRMQCALLGCYLNLAHPDPAVYAHTVEIYKAHLRFAQKIGAAMVGTETGAPNADYRSCPECWTEESLQLFMERVAPVIRCAEEIGQPFAIEPVCRHIVSTPERCRRVLDAFRSPMLSVILDAVNLLKEQNAAGADAIVADAIGRLGDAVALLHMKDYLVRGTPACEQAQASVANSEMYDGVLSLACGLGQADFLPLLRLAKARHLPLTLENTNPANAEAARLHLEALGAAL